jgi:antitoxin PrlF
MRKDAVMSEATVTSRGRISVPAVVRRAMGLSAGDRVVFTRLEDGTALIRAKTRSILELKGMLKGKSAKKKVTIADMNIGRS